MRLVSGIASTTDIDAHGDAFSKNALESMASQIHTRFIPHLLDHDPKQQIGVTLCARVEQLEDGGHALLVVACMFDNEQERLSHVVGAANTVWQDYLQYLDGVLESVDQRKYSGDKADLLSLHGVDEDSVSALIEQQLDSTSVWRDGRVYRIKHLVAKTGDLAVHVYRDHEPPHFHVVSWARKINARFDLDTLEPLDASISARDVRKIHDLFRKRPEALAKLRREHERMQR